MKFSSVFLYGGQLAYYTIEQRSPNLFMANLLKFNGPSLQAPPTFLELHRDGRRWYGNANDELIKEIGFDIVCRECTGDVLGLRRSNTVHIKL